MRLGFLGGKEFTIGGRTSNAYVKASALHDFGGNGGGTAYYKGRSTVVESADMNGTWYEIGLGANLGIAKNSNLYFDAFKNLWRRSAYRLAVQRRIEIHVLSDGVLMQMLRLNREQYLESAM